MSKKKLCLLNDYQAASKAPEKQPGDYLKEPEFFSFSSDQYHEIQFHSACVDRILKIPVAETEKALRDKARRQWPEGTVESWSKSMHDGVMTWVGLNPAQLQTPYAEIHELLEGIGLKKSQKVVDLGAGYGRMGMVMAQMNSCCEFVGYEMAQERVDLGNETFRRFGLKNVRMKQGNIASDSFELPDSDYYFIYDFGSLSDQKKLLSKIEKKADRQKKFAVLARGRGINALIQETAPWLTVNVEEIGNTVIYSYA